MAFARVSERLTRWIVAVTLAVAATPSIADTPQRVVSINLCPDQLAMMIAAPGQLLSVSFLATDPLMSAMPEQAQAYRINRGLAEEIYLMQPDLVLAGQFSNRATVDMLARLDIPVATFAPANTFDQIRERVVQMGDVLGQPGRAQAVANAYDADLAALRADIAERPSAVLYYPNGLTSGDRSLAVRILTAAGFENAAATAGYGAGGHLPLEVLALTQPDALITAQPYPGASRAEDVLEHPVVQALRTDRAEGSFTSGNWSCGTPHVVRAIKDLAALRRQIAGR